MNDRIFLWTGLAFLLTHEMDAIRAHEWRIFPLTAWLNDTAGYRAFTLAHVPLYAWLLGQIARPQGMGAGLAIGLDIFCIVHVILHVLFCAIPKMSSPAGFPGCSSWAPAPQARWSSCLASSPAWRSGARLPLCSIGPGPATRGHDKKRGRSDVRNRCGPAFCAQQ